MIRPLKSAMQEFRREPQPTRLADGRVWRAAGPAARKVTAGEPAASPFARFRPRWWSRGPIPL